jgi:hypothetical protein
MSYFNTISHFGPVLPFDGEVTTYSFSLFPDTIQPSGIANCSSFRNTDIIFEVPNQDELDFSQLINRQGSDYIDPSIIRLIPRFHFETNFEQMLALAEKDDPKAMMWIAAMYTCNDVFGTLPALTRILAMEYWRALAVSVSPSIESLAIFSTKRIDAFEKEHPDLIDQIIDCRIIDC